ncbi:MAG: hypothetical protein BWY81_01025 [Firmicutes bacterium ADurb.Bin467]|nr:MAG: hypothetical protein BWY81_01025 [Firmicutes bacterium ADurb.Bin467]
MQNVTCAIKSVSIPNGTPTAAKIDRNPIASMISGIIAGSIEIPSIAPEKRNFRRAMPTAPSVPTTAEIRQL